MTLEMLLTIAAVFLSVGLITGSVMAYALEFTAPGRRRLRNLGDPQASLLTPANAALTETMGPTLQKFARFIPKSPKDMSKLGKRMARAGYHGYAPIIVYSFAELLLPVLFGGTAFFLGRGALRFLFAIVAALVGYILPGLVLQRQIDQRKKVIQNGLPDALDLFIVCLEAGSSLDQAVLKTSQDLDKSYPPLATELRMITTEMRAGKPRLEAFKNFAARTGVDDVRALVNMLIQADRFGTSIGQALRTHAEVARTKRRQRAEERAAKIGVKLVFPLVFCLFPAFYVVTLGPGVVRFYRFLTEQLVNVN
jgi:tight adherence protein C